MYSLLAVLYIVDSFIKDGLNEKKKKEVGGGGLVASSNAAMSLIDSSILRL